MAFACFSVEKQALNANLHDYGFLSLSVKLRSDIKGDKIYKAEQCIFKRIQLSSQSYNIGGNREASSVFITSCNVLLAALAAVPHLYPLMFKRNHLSSAVVLVIAGDSLQPICAQT